MTKFYSSTDLEPLRCTPLTTEYQIYTGTNSGILFTRVNEDEWAVHAMYGVSGQWDEGQCHNDAKLDKISGLAELVDFLEGSERQAT